MNRKDKFKKLRELHRMRGQLSMVFKEMVYYNEKYICVAEYGGLTNYGEYIKEVLEIFIDRGLVQRGTIGQEVQEGIEDYDFRLIWDGNSNYIIFRYNKYYEKENIIKEALFEYAL